MATMRIDERQGHYHEVETLFYKDNVWKITTKSGLGSELDCVQFINNLNRDSKIFVDLKENVIILSIPSTLTPLAQRRKDEQERHEQEEKAKQEAIEDEDREMRLKKWQKQKRESRRERTV